MYRQPHNPTPLLRHYNEGDIKKQSHVGDGI